MQHATLRVAMFAVACTLASTWPLLAAVVAGSTAKPAPGSASWVPLHFAIVVMGPLLALMVGGSLLAFPRSLEMPSWKWFAALGVVHLVAASLLRASLEAAPGQLAASFAFFAIVNTPLSAVGTLLARGAAGILHHRAGNHLERPLV